MYPCSFLLYSMKSAKCFIAFSEVFQNSKINNKNIFWFQRRLKETLMNFLGGTIKCWPTTEIRLSDNFLTYSAILYTVSFLAPKIWDILPKDMKDSESLDIFKRKIKKWIPSECPCRLCKTYVPQVGFIWVVKIKDTYHLLSWRQLAFQWKC